MSAEAKSIAPRLPGSLLTGVSFSAVTHRVIVLTDTPSVSAASAVVANVASFVM